MKNKQSSDNSLKKCLLVWPPIVNNFRLSLGIPFLVSYLKSHGTANIKVFDMDVAYLRKNRFIWFFLMLEKNITVFKKVALIRLRNLNYYFSRPARGRKHVVTMQVNVGKVFQRYRNIIFYFPRRFINRVRAGLHYAANKEKRSIPWSLDLIIKSGLGNCPPLKKKKILEILEPVIGGDNLSLIGFSAMYPEQLFFSLMVSKIIKEDLKMDIPIVIGGAQVTKHISQIILNEEVYKFVDFFVTGDGEEPLLELMIRHPRESFSDIPNLYSKEVKPAKGYAKSNGTFHLYSDNFLVPDFEGFDLSIYEDRLPLIVSKGCAWSKCNFCTYATIRMHEYKVNPVARILEVISCMEKKYNSSKFFFNDDALIPELMKNISSGLIDNKLEINWACKIMLCSEFSDSKFCAGLKESGLESVEIGFESISPRILGLMNKHQKDRKNEEIKAILDTLKKADIHIHLFVIFGFPTETRNEARQTLDFLLKNRDLYDNCSIQPFCLEEGTVIFNNPDKFGISRIDKESKCMGKRLGYRYEVSEGMTQEEVIKFINNEAIRALRKHGVLY